MNITRRFDDPNMPLMQQMIDPYFYRERLTMPKFVINSGACYSACVNVSVNVNVKYFTV